MTRGRRVGVERVDSMADNPTSLGFDRFRPARSAPPDAVFFDFDGVIADTENIHIAAWEETLGEIGWELDDIDCSPAASIDDRVFFAEFLASRGVTDGDIEGWTARKQRRTIEALSRDPRIFPGVVEIVRALYDIIPLAVVTGTWRENVETALRTAGILDAFLMIVAKDDVKRPKPAPDCYRLALSSLGVASFRAAAIEDSITGYESATAAGMTCYLVGDRIAAEDRPPGAPVLESLADPRYVLRTLGFTDLQ